MLEVEEEVVVAVVLIESQKSKVNCLNYLNSYQLLVVAVVELTIKD